MLSWAITPITAYHVGSTAGTYSCNLRCLSPPYSLARTAAITRRQRVTWDESAAAVYNESKTPSRSSSSSFFGEGMVRRSSRDVLACGQAQSQPSPEPDTDGSKKGEFTHEQAQLVLDSWQEIRRDLGLHGLRFFSNILEIAPEVRSLFSFLKNYSGKLEDSPRVRQHARDIFRLTGETAVELAETGELTTLEPGLIALGERHFGYGTKHEHFAVLRKALMKTLEQAYGASLSPDLKAAWGKAYDELAEVAESGLAKASKGQGYGDDFSPYTIRK